MKKLSRIAALLAAGALLFGAAGCSDDDDGGETGGVEVKASVTPAIELEEGGDGTYVVTCTVTGDTFSAEAKLLDAGATIPATYLKLTASDSNVTISEVKVSEKFTDTVGKVSIKVTAADGAKSGTIKAELLKGTLTNTTDTVTASIGYKIKGDESEGGTVNAVWTFKGVTFGEGTLAGLTNGSKLSSDVELTATSGTGATLTAVSQSTFKSDDGSNKRGLKTDAGKYFKAIDDVTFGVKGIGSSDTSKGAIKGALKLELSADATVVIKGSVTGEADIRYILLAGADEEIIKIVPETAGDTTGQTIEENLTAGTYYIGIEGSVLASVECK